MTFHLPEPATPFGVSVKRRIHEEYLIWLTAIRLHGLPHDRPVAHEQGTGRSSRPSCTGAGWGASWDA
jgi:hypothetical protein